MFEEVVLAGLRRRFDVRPGRLVTLRTVGIGESALQERIGAWGRQDVILSYRTMPPENQIKLRFPPGFASQEMKSIVEALVARVGAGVFAIEGMGGSAGDLPSATVALLAKCGETVAAAEWGCGGRLCSLLLDGSDAARTVGCGLIWAAGERPAGLTEGADLVSEAAARALAQGIRRDSGASLGLGLTVASEPGPPATSADLGSAHVALATAEVTLYRPVQLAGGRDLIRTLAAAAAVDFLRRHILSL